MLQCTMYNAVQGDESDDILTTPEKTLNKSGQDTGRKIHQLKQHCAWFPKCM